MKLSKRLEMIVKLADVWAPGESGEKSRGICVADVGTDHGFVPICLVERGIAARALALDVRQGPLCRAREHVAGKGLEEKIELRLGDGLKPLKPGEADLVILSGMGGELMLRILKEGEHVRPFVRRWIFSPQSELSLFRHGIQEMGLSICYEEMLREDGKYYTIMVAKPGQMNWSREYCYRYGRHLIQNGSPVLAEYLEKEAGQFKEIRERLLKGRQEASAGRLREVEERLREIGIVRECLAENTKIR